MPTPPPQQPDSCLQRRGVGRAPTPRAAPRRDARAHKLQQVPAQRRHLKRRERLERERTQLLGEYLLTKKSTPVVSGSGSGVGLLNAYALSRWLFPTPVVPMAHSLTGLDEDVDSICVYNKWLALGIDGRVVCVAQLAAGCAGGSR